MGIGPGQPAEIGALAWGFAGHEEGHGLGIGLGRRRRRLGLGQGGQQQAPAEDEGLLFHR